MADVDKVLAILFDSDNTLYNYQEAQLAACKAVIDHINIGNATILNSYFLLDPFDNKSHRIINYYLNDLGIFDEKILHTACTIYNYEKLKKIILFPEVYETMVSLRDRKILLGVVTNAPSHNVISYLEKNKVKDFFQCIVSPEEANCKKPSINFFKLALSLLSVKPENCVMVGDNVINDLIPAKKMGMKTILFENERIDTKLATNKVINKNPNIDHSIKYFPDILGILDKISSHQHGEDISDF